MKIITGNLIALIKDGVFDFTAAGCNCFNTFGAGLNLQLKKEFPETYLADLQTKKGNKDKLGNYSIAILRHSIHLNYYTQYFYGRDKKYFEEWALKACLKKTLDRFGGLNKRFGFPLIGCGLAGGDEKIVLSIFEEEMDGEDVTIVKYAGKN